MSRRGIKDDDERHVDDKQGSSWGGVISLFCISVLILQFYGLLSTMYNGGNDIIKY